MQMENMDVLRMRMEGRNSGDAARQDDQPAEAPRTIVDNTVQQILVPFTDVDTWEEAWSCTRDVTTAIRQATTITPGAPETQSEGYWTLIGTQAHIWGVLGKMLDAIIAKQQQRAPVGTAVIRLIRQHTWQAIRTWSSQTCAAEGSLRQQRLLRHAARAASEA